MTGAVNKVEDLRVFQAFRELAFKTEEITRAFPGDFRWLRIQALRSSVSCMANLTEGFYSQYSTEYVQCLFRVRREGRETQTHLAYAGDLGLVNAEKLTKLSDDYDGVLRGLNKLIEGIQSKIARQGKGRQVREDQVLYESGFDPPIEDIPPTPDPPNP